MFIRLLLASALAGTLGHAAAPHVSIAAAANLTYAVSALNAEFSRTAPEVKVTVTLGSSGNLFAQITHGAPFDVFLSADREYPEKLVAAHAANAKSLCNFATGRLALWTVRPGLDLSDLRAVVRSEAVTRIAIAQPGTAPYGRAAASVLRHLGVQQDAQRKLVMGENIAQTAQFVETGNADCGFVALSLLASGRLAHVGRWIELPATLYADEPLAHAAVVTSYGETNPAARSYVTFLRSDAARKILEANGYGAP